ncbi:MAG TPA: hypothetical protein VKU40_02560 [Thermoanaerobaculia bacterium]|nr:hypothetical protein [Thermoanaerobaculia bacterium]
MGLADRFADLQDVPASRFLLFGCGFVFLLVGLAALVFLWFADELLARSLDSRQSKVEVRIAEEVPEYERNRLAWAFADARAAVAAGRAPDEALADAQRLLADYSRRGAGEPVTAEEVAELTAALDRVAGREPAADP